MDTDTATLSGTLALRTDGGQGIDLDKIELPITVNIGGWTSNLRGGIR